MARAPFDFAAGETVAGYRVEAVIGRGGSATVYRAVAAMGGPAVALKIMHEHDPSGVGRKRFAREAALLQKLQHPHVVRMFDYGYTDRDLPFIVFELLQGRSLKSAVRHAGAFAPERVGRITLQLLDALVVAHDMGIIHRDIKPGNVFLRSGQAHDHALLLDLGLAKALEGDGIETNTITGTGYRLGTPRYMSPEMARGDKAHAPGDLYAIGLLMAEMLDGEPVVRAQAQIDILMAHASPGDLDVSPAVQGSPFHSVVRRALAKDLKVRYRNAIQMRADVEGALTLHERALATAARFENVSAEMAPTLAVDRGHFDALLAERAPGTPPRIALGGTIDMAGHTVHEIAQREAGATLPIHQLPADGLVPPPPSSVLAPPARQRPRRAPLWSLGLLLLAAGALAVMAYILAGR